MAFIKSVRRKFVEDMTEVVREALNDTTPKKDYSQPHNPPSTYGSNLRQMRNLTDERKRQGVSSGQVLQGIIGNLEAPYKNYTNRKIEELKSAGANDGDVIDALIEAYENADS